MSNAERWFNTPISLYTLIEVDDYGIIRYGDKKEIMGKIESETSIITINNSPSIVEIARLFISSDVGIKIDDKIIYINSDGEKLEYFVDRVIVRQDNKGKDVFKVVYLR